MVLISRNASTKVSVGLIFVFKYKLETLMGQSMSYGTKVTP